MSPTFAIVASCLRRPRAPPFALNNFCDRGPITWTRSTSPLDDDDDPHLLFYICFPLLSCRPPSLLSRRVCAVLVLHLSPSTTFATVVSSLGLVTRLHLTMMMTPTCCFAKFCFPGVVVAVPPVSLNYVLFALPFLSFALQTGCPVWLKYIFLSHPFPHPSFSSSP